MELLPGVITQYELTDALIGQRQARSYRREFMQALRAGAVIEPGPLTLNQPVFDVDDLVVASSDVGSDPERRLRHMEEQIEVYRAFLATGKRNPDAARAFSLIESARITAIIQRCTSGIERAQESRDYRHFSDIAKDRFVCQSWAFLLLAKWSARVSMWALRTRQPATKQLNTVTG